LTPGMQVRQLFINHPVFNICFFIYFFNQLNKKNAPL